MGSVICYKLVFNFRYKMNSKLNIDLYSSQGSWLHDINGDKYLDCYSQCGSQPLGWNYDINKYLSQLYLASGFNICNGDFNTYLSVQFKEYFQYLNHDFQHFFYIAGGSPAVENALKVAFDWKYKLLAAKGGVDMDEYESQVDILHMKYAFHGRTGYSLSLTNTTPDKTDLFPKFYWSRLKCPAINKQPPTAVEEMEEQVIEHIEDICTQNEYVAGLIIEPIQGEGGDNHFRPEFLKKLYDLSCEFNFLLIFDEVQTGVGLTGKLWNYEYLDFVPDIVVFGKKTQVCGIMATNTKLGMIENHAFKCEKRINSTWGGNTVDMVRGYAYLQTIMNENILSNVVTVGDHFLNRLREIPEFLNVRGKGLMIAFECLVENFKEKLYNKLLFMQSPPNTVRLRPHLTLTEETADEAVRLIKDALC